MLIRHSAEYLLARGVSAIIQLVALGVFSHIVSPAEYGRYSLAVVVAFTARAILFEWLYLGVLRLLPSGREIAPFLATVLKCYLVLSAICILGTLFTWLLFKGTTLADVPVFSTLALLLAAAFHEINLQLAARWLSPRRYGALSLLKAIFVLGFGAIGATAGEGESGLLLGVAIGYALSSLLLTRRTWQEVWLEETDRSVFRELVRYGLPLGVTAGLGIVVWNTDRIMLGALSGAGAVGPYALGAEIAAQTVGMLMITVNLAGFPLALRAMEQGGAEVARTHLKRHAMLLAVVGLPSAAALALFAEDLSLVVLGEHFRDQAAPVMVWIALAAFINGIKAYYFDIAFQLKKRTSLQVSITVATGALNLVLNLGLIPMFGVIGAGIATTVSAFLGLMLSIGLGRKIFILPFPLADWFKCVFATAIMILIVTLVEIEPGVSRLLGGSILGFACLLAIGWLSNVGGIRDVTVSKSSSLHHP